MIKYYVILFIRQLTKIFFLFPMKKNRILFHTFSGKNCSDSPRYIAEMLTKNEGEKYEIIWAVADMERWKKLKEKGWKLVKYKSLRYLYFSATSKFIITNMGPFKAIVRRKNQEIINTWHGGGAYKKTGQDNPYKDRYQVKMNKNIGQKDVSLFLSSSKLFKEYEIKAAFGYYGNIMECGLPRNDIFFKSEKEKKEIVDAVKKELRLKCGVHVVLFAPTWRNYLMDDFEILDYERVVEALRERFGGEWVFSFRGHHLMKEKMDLEADIEYIDLSEYEDMQKLLLMADVLITDYSSSIWDYSLTGKPAFLFTPDFECYMKTFDFYTPIDQWGFPYACTVDALYQLILNFDYEIQERNIQNSHVYFGITESGRACERVCEYIDDKMVL